MPREVDRDTLRRLVDEEGAQLVEVLPRMEYEWAHLPGAIHLSLKEFSEGLVRSTLRPDRPVIAYCNDFL